MLMAGNTVYVQGSYVDVHDNEVVNLSIDKSGEVHVNGQVVKDVSPEVSAEQQQAVSLQAEPQPECVLSETARVPSEAERPVALPPPLGSDEAARYWQRLQRERFVDASCRLLPTTTRQQAMYIAEAFAAKLGLKTKWKLFEQLWGINNLAQEKYACVETGKMPPRAKEIDAIFED